MPAPIALAASFDLASARDYGSLIGMEARGRAADVAYGSGVNLARVAQGGRDFEYLGEDPQLASALVTEEVLGAPRGGRGALDELTQPEDHPRQNACWRPEQARRWTVQRWGGRFRGSPRRAR